MAEFFSDVTVEGRMVETDVTVTHDSPIPELSVIECVSIAPASEPSLRSLLIASGDVPVPTATSGASEEHEVASTQAEDIDAKQSPRRKNPRRSFTTEFKLECVEHAEKSKNKTETARLFNVNRRRVQEWCIQKEKLIAIPKQQKRLSGGGRRQVYLPGAEECINSDNNIILGDPGPTDTIQMLEPSLQNKINEEKAVSDTSLVHSVDTVTPDTIMDSILRSLVNADPSVVPLNMIKIIQELSLEVASQDPKVSVESMIRDMSIETLLQKSVDAVSNHNFSQYLTVGEGSNHELSQSDEADQSSQAVVSSVQQESCATTESGAQGQEDPIHGEGVHGTTVEDGAVLQPPLLDATVHATILDALMQVVTSVQEASPDLLQSGPQPIVDPDAPEKNLQDTPVAMAIDPVTMQEEVPNSLSSSSLTLDSTSQQPLNSNEALSDDTAAFSHADALSSATRSPKPVARSKVKKKYTVEFKLECVAHAESTSKCAAARQYNVDRRRVQDWCSQKEKLQQLKHIPVDDQKLVDAEIEKKLAVWVKQEQETGKAVSRRMVGEEAVRLYRESGNTGFSASIGWVAKFMIRNSISLVSPGRSQHEPMAISAADAETNI